MADHQFITAANQLLACAVEAFAANPNPPSIACLTWGDPVPNMGVDGDDCCNGAIYVNEVEFYPSSNLFPDRTVERQSGPCGVLAWAVRFQLTAFRCWPDDGMTRITCDARTAAVTQLFDDQQAIRKALCCFQKVNKNYLTAITEGVPLDPAGGCAGSYARVSIQLPQCDAC